MREAHLHLGALGESLSMPSLERCQDLGAALDLLADEARGCAPAACPGGGCESHGPGPRAGESCAVSGGTDTCRGPARTAGARFIRATGARVEAWPEARWPTLDELDRATGDTPVVVMSFDHHSAVANSAALRAANLRPGQAIAPNGLVCVDARGRATGLLHEQAAYAAWNAAPEPTPGQRRRDVLRALKLLGAMGFDEVHDLHAPSWLAPLLGEIDRAGGLTVRVRLFAPADRFAQDLRDREVWESERVRLAGAKVFYDGTLNSRTALVLHPYAHPDPTVGPRGKAMMTHETLAGHMRAVRALAPELELAVHAIGDAAVRDVLDRWELLGGGRGLRIEHCELIDEHDVPRFAQLGVTCSVQPCHLLADAPVLKREFPTRLHRVLPLKELIESGLIPGQSLLFGSDAPIVRPNPEDSVIAATLRRRRDEPDAHAIAREQAIGEELAWACFGNEGDSSRTHRAGASADEHTLREFKA